MSRKQLWVLFVCSLIHWTVGNGLLPLLPVYATHLGADQAAVGYYLSFVYVALLAGTVSTNPILLVIAFLLVLAWKTAGWWGLDRWLLPALGTPWRPGEVFHDHERHRPPRQVEHPGQA